MSAVSLMSVLTPAAPGGASVDASVEAATASAVFADLMLKEEAQAAPPVVQLVPVAQASETTAPIEAAPVEPAKDDIAVAPAPPAWFAPPPPVQQTAAPTAPANPTAPTTEAPPAVAATPTPAPLAVSETVEAAPVAPTAEPAADTTATAAPVSAATPPLATISAALKAALPAVLAEPDAAPEPPSTESDEPSDAPPPSRPGAALPAQDAALLSVTGFRSGAGERLASAREAIQTAATATGNAEATANRPAQADASIDAATSAPAARPAAALTLAETPAAAAAAPPVDGEAPAAPQQGAVEAPSQAPGAQRDLGLSQLSRATVETTAQIAAQIVKKLDGRSTRFDMALTPEGLGRVDVSLEIESDGQVTARLAFDNPAAAADLRARADELRRQLLDAGLQLSRDDLEFAEHEPSSGFSGGAFERQPDRRAFSGAARLAAEADSVVPPPSAWTSLSLTPDRVDLKV
jgi:hypothetical protein